MGFTEAVRHCFNNFANFQGRAQRSQYWFFVLFSVLLGFAANIVDSAIFGTGPDRPGMVSSLTSLALLVPSLAVTARRLHDHNRSGWWQIAPYGMALAAVLTGWMDPPILFTAAMIAALILLIVLFVWMVTRGTVGVNDFRPDPLGPQPPGDPGGPGRDQTYHSSSIPRVDPD